MTEDKMERFEHLVSEAADLWTDEGESNEEYERALVELHCRASGLSTADFRDDVADVIRARVNPRWISEVTLARSMKVIRDHLSGAKARLVCSYQMFGDLPGDEWATRVLDHAMETGRIEGYVYSGSHLGAFGIELVQFCLDVRVPATIAEDRDWSANVRRWGTTLANEIVGDSDAECHFVAMVPAVTQ